MTPEQIANSFTYHPPFGTQTARYMSLRDAGKELALLIDACCPQSHEQDVAIDRLSEAIMWANKAIAVNEKMPANTAPFRNRINL